MKLWLKPLFGERKTKVFLVKLVSSRLVLKKLMFQRFIKLVKIKNLI